MKKCDYCGKELDTMPFHCRYCGKEFCTDHRLPENHECDFDLMTDSTEKLLYSDISELLEKDLTVADIYHNYTVEKFSKEQTIDLLFHVFEQSKDTKTRIHCIEAFRALEFKEAKVYQILEEIILSDRNKQIRDLAFKAIKDLFPEKSKQIQEWRQKHKK